jgi:hypothetical protein
MGHERRRAPRIEVLGRLHGHVVSLDTPVTVREISMVGLSFSAPIPFPIGAEHEFRLTLGDGSAVMLKGRVVRAQEAPGGEAHRIFVMGVQFLDSEAETGDDPRIEGVVERLK